MDEKGSVAYKALASSFAYYMSKVKDGGVPLGECILSHRQLFFAWRFAQLKRNLANYTAGTPTRDEQKLAASEPGWRAERKTLSAQVDTLNQRRIAADGRVNALLQSRARHLQGQQYNPRPNFSSPYDDQLEEATKKASDANEEYLRANGRLQTLPDVDGSLEQHLKDYDRQLLKDAQFLETLVQRSGNRARLRPHYRAMLEAYEAEFLHNRGLKDERIIEFFENYVHDSLAGFANDATLPSDPRVIYIGGDEKLKYAQNETQPFEQEVASA